MDCRLQVDSKFNNLHHLTPDVDKGSTLVISKKFSQCKSQPPHLGYIGIQLLIIHIIFIIHTISYFKYIFQGEGYECVFENNDSKFAPYGLRKSNLELCLKNSKIKVLELYPYLNNKVFLKVLDISTFFLGKLSCLEQINMYYKSRQDTFVQKMKKKPKVSPNCNFQVFIL